MAFYSALFGVSRRFTRKKKHPVTFLGNNPLLSLEHWPLWLAWAQWPCPIPFHQHSGQCEAANRSADKRCTDGEILMTDSFLPLIFDEAIVPRALDGDTRYKRGSIPIAQGKQKPSLCFAVSLTFFLLRTYSISCTAGEGFLIFDCLYLQIGWWPFVCRWPTLRWHLIPWQKMCGHALWHSLSAWGDY